MYIEPVAGEICGFLPEGAVTGMIGAMSGTWMLVEILLCFPMLATWQNPSGNLSCSDNKSL